jgi:arginyl-tRNA synthetase
MLYVIGVTQSLHLEMVYATARAAGWLPPTTTAEHIAIGSVTGTDGKLLRTRAGDSLRLMALLDEAVTAAAAILAELRPDLGGEQSATIARQIGIGAVKYADLSVAHDSAYAFDLKRMLALTGNTGPYLQYAVARSRSMARKAAGQGLQVPPDARIDIGTEAERTLAMHLLDFGETVTQVGCTCEPHRLCAYLFDLAQAFSSFWEQCPVLRSDVEPAVRDSRLALAALTERVLVTGLDLLGLEAPEQM